MTTPKKNGNWKMIGVVLSMAVLGIGIVTTAFHSGGRFAMLEAKTLQNAGQIEENKETHDAVIASISTVGTQQQLIGRDLEHMKGDISLAQTDLAAVDEKVDAIKPTIDRIDLLQQQVLNKLDKMNGSSPP